MRNQLFTRTTVTAAVIAIAMLMTLALLTTPGNNALGQNLPTIGFESSNLNPGVHEPALSPYRVNVTLAPSYKVRYRESGETSWREHSDTASWKTKRPRGTRTTTARAYLASKTTQPSPEERASRKENSAGSRRQNTGVCIRENGKLLTTKANTWPRMYNASPGKPNDDIAGASRRISLLDQNQQHEIQVATCTDQSCDATGDWSSSRYAYSR